MILLILISEKIVKGKNMTELLKNSQYNNNEYEIRKKKAISLQEQGINPWPNFSLKKELIIQIKTENKNNIQYTDKKYSISGRIISIREHGKSIFISIKDETDIIQGYIKKENVLESTFTFIQKYLDNGDIVNIQGQLFLTKTQELTIRLESITLLSKCLHFIPDNHTGLENIELRYRQRYLDLIVNNNVKDIFKKRTYLIQHIRNLLDNQGYLEVETPMLHLIPGGANAKPFITHHNSLNIDLYLRIAPELYLKKMIIGGFDKVYEINKNFRNFLWDRKFKFEFILILFIHIYIYIYII